MVAAFDETILVIEDDASLARGLEHNLGYEGYRVLRAADGPTGLHLALEQRPDLIVLDLMLPGKSGLDVLRALRHEGLDAQVIILSARGLEKDRVRGLQLGADDYVSKPFSLPELLARIDAALRRPRRERARSEQRSIEIGAVCVHLGRREVLRDGAPLPLTAREVELLVLLASEPDRTHTRAQLLQRVWGHDYEGTDRTVDNFIRNLRRQIEPDPTQPVHLRTVHGVGYRLVLRPEASPQS